MASSGHFDPSQTYGGYREVKVLDPSCTECLIKGKEGSQHFNLKYSKFHLFFVGKKPCFPGIQASNIKIYWWNKKDGPFRQEFPVSEDPTPDGTSGLCHFTDSKHREVARWTNFGGPIQIGGRKIYSSSEVPISRINTECVVKRIRKISNSPTTPDAEDND
ncbi:hypothetical protein O181_010029 [Austropuccinia psidii MF-1]|uniref:Uncharacterized protein n=1 Tax=Austropuccinia psidii MF-1 TaxID=1389203 RepID=A0A9Q3BRU2_9BASI|nr:hypothetical protein [Austropuccinia psidii MF-1]